MSRNNYFYSISAVALSLGLPLLSGTAAVNANCEFNYPNLQSALDDDSIIGGKEARRNRCNSYDLSFGGARQVGFAMPFSRDRGLQLYYNNRTGPVEASLVFPRFSAVRFSLDLYLGGIKITKDNDRLKHFTFHVISTDTEQGRRVAYHNFVNGDVFHSWSVQSWEGSIRNIGESILTFKPNLDRSNPNEFRTINLFWYPNRPSEGGIEFYTKTRKYSFENPYENSIFHVGLKGTPADPDLRRPADQELSIPAGGELAIHSGVALELWSTRLLFEEAPSSGQPSEPGKLSFYLSGKDRPFGYGPVPGEELIRRLGRFESVTPRLNMAVPPTGPGPKIKYPFLLIKSPSDNLVLRKLALYFRPAFYRDNDWADESLLLVKIENSNNESSVGKICFAGEDADKDCDAIQGQELYLLPGEEDNPGLVIEISEDRTELLLRPRSSEDDTDLPSSSLISVSDIAEDLSPPPIRRLPTLESRDHASGNVQKGLREYLLIDSLLDNVSTILVKGTREVSLNEEQTPSAQAQAAALVTPTWTGDIALDISSHFRYGWSAAGATQGLHQHFNLHVDGSYRQFGMGATGFYTKVVIGNEHASDLIGGLVKAAYLNPSAGFSANLYFGGGLTPEKDGEYRVIMTGIALDYQYIVNKNVNITLAPNLRLDAAPLFTKADSTSDFAVQKLPVRLQGGMRVALDTSDLIPGYQLKFSFPIKLGIMSYFGLNKQTNHLHEVYGVGGLDIQLTALENLVVGVGYSLRYGKIYSTHLLNIRFQFQV